jgi:hypothetical protein
VQLRRSEREQRGRRKHLPQDADAADEERRRAEEEGRPVKRKLRPLRLRKAPRPGAAVSRGRGDPGRPDARRAPVALAPLRGGRASEAGPSIRASDGALEPLVSDASGPAVPGPAVGGGRSLADIIADPAGDGWEVAPPPPPLS